MKHKRIAALIGMTLLFIAVSSTALAVGNMWCNNCNKFVEFTSLGFRIIDETAHAVVVKCNECGTERWASTGPHVGGTATCAKKAVCRGCGAEYGEKLSYHKNTVLYSHKVPTCTESGWDSYFGCLDCGYSAKKEIGPLGHDYGSWTSNGDGTHTRTCSHDGSHTETVSCSGGTASCSAKAVCAECGAEYGETDPDNHTLTHHEAKAATCTEIGWDAYDTCSRCNYTTYTELPALNHALVNHDAQAPTCTEKGWNAYETCSRCDYTTYTELPTLNHDLAHHEAKAPTCTEIGWNAYDTCKNCSYTTYTELPALNHDYQAVTVAPTCETDGYTIFTCSRCKDSYTADPTDKLGHKFGAWSPNGTGSQSASCLRQGCAHTGSTDCRKFTFRTAEGEALTFCPVCGQAENAAQLEMIEAATAWAASGSLSAEDVTARTNGEYLSVAFETAGSLMQHTGLVRLALPAQLLEGKTLVRIAPDGTQTEMPFETKDGKIILTLDFANSELPVMLFRLVPQTAAL